MGQVLVNVKWDDATDINKSKVHQLFKVTAAAMGLSQSDAIIRAMDEFNITHGSAISDLAYKIPERKE